MDGVPTAGTHGQVDLTDLYAFPTPAEEDHLTVILNLYPGVEDTGHFSSKVFYNIGMMAVSIDQDENPAIFKTNPKTRATVKCSFTDPEHHVHGDETDKGEVTCEFKSR